MQLYIRNHQVTKKDVLVAGSGIVMVLSILIGVFFVQKPQNLFIRAFSAPNSYGYGTFGSQVYSYTHIPSPPITAPVSLPPTEIPTPVLTGASVAPFGEDIDKNGCLDIQDFSSWYAAMKAGAATPGTDPDVNNDNKTDTLDFNLWYGAMQRGERPCS